MQSPMDSILAHGPTTQRKYTTDKGTDQLTMSALGNETAHLKTHRTPQHTVNNTSSLDGDHTRLKLHSLLDSYLEPSKIETKEHKTSYRVKFKPPVPKFPKSASSKQTQSLLPTTHSPLMSSELFQSTTAKLGPHQWVEYPRRSPKRQRSLSAPSSPVRRAKRANSENIRPLSADFDDFLALLDLEDPQEEVMDTRPPFVVRRIDQHLMGRRDFCGCSRTKNKESKMSKSDASRSERKQSARIVPAYLNESIQMSHDDYTTTDHSGTLSRSLISPFKQRPHSVQFTTPIDTPTLSKPTTHCSNGKQELLSKYQVAGSSHVRRGVDSPRRAIEEKIERLTAECYDFKVSSVLR